MYADRTEPLSAGILALRGDWDFLLKDSLEKLLIPLEGLDVAILALGEMTFCDSSLVCAMIVLQKKMKSAGRLGKLKIVQPSPTLRHVLALCSLDKIFVVCDTMNEAMSDLADAVVMHMGSEMGDEDRAFGLGA